MRVCPSCGRENPEDARFCSGCGTPLEERAAAREERKVVTVLFCDLVGSTATAERLDPEDVRALLSRYHERVKAELERFGGTVEKFIGDAVMAVFGAPTAHEDDPERAVRAALAVCEWAVAEPELEVRVAVNTGEALVVVDARPAEGEGMVAGDVVNTAARLQAHAPVNGVLVGEATFRATDSVIDYSELDPVDAKGKTAAIRVWQAVAPRARLGADVGHTSELVGRERELRILTEALGRAHEERAAQLVTLVGVPGIGKSRLVFELYRAIEQGPDTMYWRQGRALPYGDGVTFAPLTEIAKAHTGILETDDAGAAEAKLRRALGEVVEPEEIDWLARELRPLIGLGGEPQASGRETAFAAWRRLFEALADRRTLVLVFEDLHWADEEMLDFVDHLVEWARGVPLLALCTTRPELFDRRPNWGAGKLNSAVTALGPLSDGDTAKLVHTLLERSAMPAELQEEMLERAGGNPLYAEEFARFVGGRTDDALLPETVQGIIAARLDLLPATEKGLLQDAAVLGKVFWTGALASIAETADRDVEDALHSLERKDFVARARASSVAGETEYVFRHILVRDVAYAQIPRARRTERHERAAVWIESLSPERSEDRAEMLAHHYLSALELASAAGRPAEGLAARASDALRDAGDRAFALHAYAAAARFYRAALDRWTGSELERGRLLFGLGRSLGMAFETGEREVEEAAAILVAEGDRETAAEAHVQRSRHAWVHGDRDAYRRHLDAALELARDLPPSRAKAYTLSQAARARSFAGDVEGGIAEARAALALAEELGAEDVRVSALTTLGTALSNGRDLEHAIPLLEEATAIAHRLRSPEGGVAGNNLAVAFNRAGDVRRSSRTLADTEAFLDEFGGLAQRRFLRSHVAIGLFEAGEWDDALARCDELIAQVEQGAPHYQEMTARRIRARIRLGRGDLAGAVVDAADALAAAVAVQDPQATIPTRAVAARVHAELDDVPAATLHVDSLLPAVGPYEEALLNVAIVLALLGRAAESAPLAGHAVAEPWQLVLGRLAEDDGLGAAQRLEEMGLDFEAAFMRLRSAHSFARAGRRPEAEALLALATPFFEQIRATRYLGQAEALLRIPA